MKTNCVRRVNRSGWITRGWKSIASGIVAVLLPWCLIGAPVALGETSVSTGLTPKAQMLTMDTWLIPGGFSENRQPDGNTVVFKGSEGLVVLDTGRHTWHRQAILDLAVTNGVPIVAIINSHWHLDHVSGNPDLRAAYPSLKVYASGAIDSALTGFLAESAKGANEYLESSQIPAEMAEDIRGDLATFANGEALKPDVVIEESATLRLAGRDLQVNLAVNGPTEGDVWLYDTNTRIAAVGDLVTLPVPFLDTACVEGWQSALASVASIPFETLVPGHGRPMGRPEFEQYRTAFDHLVQCADSDQDKGACAASWVANVSSLLEDNDMESARAEGMAAYYVDVVLRGNRTAHHCK